MNAVAEAGGRCLLGSAGGELLWWSTNSGSPDATPAPADRRVLGCSSGGAVASMCARPAGKAGGVWHMAAATAGMYSPVPTAYFALSHIHVIFCAIWQPGQQAVCPT